MDQCRCTLHPRKNHLDACRFCAVNHVPASKAEQHPRSPAGAGKGNATAAALPRSPEHRRSG